jgi:hypothetical protein
MLISAHFASKDMNRASSRLPSRSASKSVNHENVNPTNLATIWRARWFVPKMVKNGYKSDFAHRRPQ